MTIEFDEVISDIARLREILPVFEGSNTMLKVMNQLNSVATKFINMSPIVMIATKGGDDLIDISPKGDPAGFVEIYDDKTLIIPDRLGNHRVDGFTNLLVDPSIAILFIVPGHPDTLRIAGTAKIVKDKSISQRHAVNGKEPVLALVVNVEEAYMHCAKAFMRSHIWKTNSWPEKHTVPRLADWVIETVKKPQSLEDVTIDHTADEETRLY